MYKRLVDDEVKWFRLRRQYLFYRRVNLERERVHNKPNTGMVIVLLSIAILLNIDRLYPTTTTTTSSTAVVVAFGFYYHLSTTASPTSNPQSIRSVRPGHRHGNTDLYWKRSATRKTIWMIHNNNNNNDDDDDDDDNDKKNVSRRHTTTFVRRTWFESTTKRQKSLFDAVHRRFRTTVRHLWEKQTNDICSQSSSALNLSGRISNTSTSATAPTETLVVATSSTSSSSIRQQISDHVAKISDDTNIGSCERRTQEQEVSTATISASTTTTATSSVHVQLTDPILIRPESETQGEVSFSTDKASKTEDIAQATTKPHLGTTTVVVHTYNDTTTNQTWKALNISRRKFRSYLLYCEVWNHNYTKGATMEHTSNTSHIDDYTGIETVHHSILSTKSKPTAEGVNDDSAAMTENNKREALLNKEQLHNVTSQLRNEWRALWKVGRLITDRTELLAVYPSDFKPDTNHDESKATNDATQVATTTNEHQVQQSKPALKKRGGFADLLLLYTDRLMAILRDEHDDNDHNNKSSSGTQSMDIVNWLENNYGQSETRDLQYENFQLLDEATKLIKLKHFLEWFRSQFPYFYDRCDSCGASIKEDLANNAEINAASDPSDKSAPDEATCTANELASASQVTPNESNNAMGNVALNADEANSTEGDTTDDSDEMESEHQTFVGYVYPNHTELIGKASRTELYQCHQCSSFTRFPRYNAAQFVLSQKRGRCGEYSMLLYRFIRALHHECRWVVDWADHVWVEVLVQSSNHGNARWIHLDPCEAAVDENFIYQGWGKKQNYIVGFYLPTMNNMKASLQHLSDNQEQMMSSATFTTSSNISYIEDITQRYTTEEWNDVCQRRDETESHIQASIIKATQELQNKLLEYYNFTTAATTSNAIITR